MVKMSVDMDDEALRQKLASFGETVGKITAKTRPLYIKKLNHLQARQTMAEKSDVQEKRIATRRRTRGSAMAAPQESVANYRLDFEDESDAEMTNFEENSRANQKTKRRTVHGSNLSEMSVEVSPSRSGGRRSVLKSSQLREVENDGGLQQNSSPRPSVARIAPRIQTPRSGQHLLDTMRTDRVTSSLMDFSDSERTEEDVKDTASVGINTSAWLDNSIGSIFGNKSLNDSGVIGKKDDRLTSTPARSYQQGSFQRGSHADQWRGQSLRLEVHRSTKWQFISRLLVICVLVFFFGLVSLYLVVTLRDIPAISHASDKMLLLCTGENNVNCLNPEQQEILVKIVDILASRAGDFDCGDKSVNRVVTKAELFDLLKSDPNFPDHELFQENFDTVLAKISAFPQLKIRLLDEDNKTVDNGHLVHLESIEAKMSFICRLNKSLLQVVLTLLTVVASTVAIVCMSVLVRRKLTRMKEEKREVHHLVQDIVSLLQNHAIACQSDSDLEPYLSIANVRDALIPLDQRKQKCHLWNRAVELVSTSESRVREELQLTEGDKQESVWRYLDIPNDPLKKSDQKLKPWSDMDVKAVSACLKISNILDGSEDCRKEVVDGPIRDAVFDRCGSYHGILHFDIYEKCVYIKLVSESAAGQAFKYLHGWYYRGKLISVRYVTPLFYRTLFPESTYAMVPLRSSTHRRRSGVLSGSEHVKTSF